MNDLATTTAAAPARSFCTFRRAQRLHGIEVFHVREVSPHFPMTPVPQAPPAVRGLANLRSRIYLILDLRPLLGLPPVDCGQTSRFIILKPEIGQDLGILVEEGGDIAHVSADRIESAAGRDSSGDVTSLIAGVCKLESELMTVVDPTQIAQVVARLFDRVSR
jgi:purine-binding chemotaxis protein CheW